MKNNVVFEGIYPALVTPLKDDATIHVPAIEGMMRWQLQHGVHGFYVLGGTGEGGVLAESERMLMAEAAVDVVKNANAKVIVQVGAADTKVAVRLARHAGHIKADAISSVYPNFFCQYNVAETADYYQALSNTSGLPVICYLTPSTPSSDIVALVEQLMAVDGVIGIKYTLPNYFTMQQLKRINHGNINILNGPDETLLCGLCMGADGGIGATYNIMPDRFVALYNQYKANDVLSAQKMQHDLNGVIEVVLKYGIISTVKLGLEIAGFDVGYAAFPGRRFNDEERHEIQLALHDAGLFI